MELPAPDQCPTNAEDEAVLQQFEAAWQGQPPPRLEDFLPRADGAEPGARRRLLAELVKVDLSCRWQRTGTGGTPSHLEDYVGRFPELGPIEALPAAWIGEEYFIRQRWGDRPRHADYAARFPHHGDRLLEILRRVDAELEEYAPGDGPANGGLARPFQATIPQPVAVAARMTSADFVEQIRRLPLLSAAHLAELVSDLQHRFRDPVALARALLERDWLTAYQVNHLLQRRGAELVLGPYQILGRLGSGGTGTVFKARHQHMQRLAAVKLLRPELEADAEALGRFYREIRLLSRVAHPHVIHAYDAGPLGNHLALVMEYAPGIDLHQLVKRSGPLPPTQACDYVRQAALGLQHIHQLGLVHRDIKPSNLLLNRRQARCTAGPPPGVHSDRRQGGTGDAYTAPPGEDCPWGLVKILDLGLGLLRGVASGLASSSSVPDSCGALRTAAGAVMIGTPDYLAPEQALDFHSADIRADIYSLGCTLFYLLTGQPPFPGGGLAEKLLQHQQAQPPTLERLWPQVPAGLAQVVRRMIAKRPDERFPMPAEVADALRPWIEPPALPVGGATAAEWVAAEAPIDAPGGLDQDGWLAARSPSEPGPSAAGGSAGPCGAERPGHANGRRDPPHLSPGLTMSEPTSLDEFVELARKSKILPIGRVQDILLQQTPGLRTPGQLAGILVRDGLLTHFQAEQLLLGRWRNFFISGKYKVLDKLGTGGMATVYLCEHAAMRRRVALKVLPARQAENPTALQRFQREGRAAAALSHPNVVHAFDVDHDGPLHFLVMEYVDGTDLNQLVKQQGPLDVSRACHYVAQAALGLQHAYEHGLVHRDIKPGNLLLDRAGTVKVLDMGLARFFRDETDDLTQRLDGAAVLGTADYLSPEQAMNSHQVDIRSDVYSLGVTLYFLLTGRPPFEGGTVPQKLLWHQVRTVPSVREARPEVPEALAAVAARMLAKDPAQRYQTPVAVAEALAPWTAHPLPLPARTEMPTSPSVTLLEPPPPALPMSSARCAGLSRTQADDPAPGPAARDGADSVLGLPSPGRRAGQQPRWLLINLVGGVVLLGGLALLGTRLFHDLQPPQPAESAGSSPPEEGTARSPAVARPDPGDGIVDDFRGGLAAWESQHATVDRGVVQFQGAAATFGFIRRKLPGCRGDFTVSADFTQLGQKGNDWNQVLDLYFGDAHLYLKDKGKYNRWIISANADRRVDKAFWYSARGDGGATVGIVGVRQTFKIRRVGARFTFSVTQEGTEHRIDEHDLPELGALTEVGARSWTYGAPRNNSTVENFRLVKGKEPPKR